MFLTRLTRRLFHFALCWEQLGFLTALKVMLVRPWYAGLMRVTLPNGRDFYFRGKREGGIVLSHFCHENYYIDDTLQPVRTIIDGGAYIGDETIRFAANYPQARIVAVEAASENFELLERNVQGLSRIDAIYGAIYPRSARLRMLGGPSLESFQVEVTDDEAATVPAWTIPSLMARLGASEIDILKLDIEGAEFELFDIDTAPWIGSVRAIIFEVDYHRPEIVQRVFRAVEALEFETYVAGENLVMIRKDTPWTLKRMQGVNDRG